MVKLKKILALALVIIIAFQLVVVAETKTNKYNLKYGEKRYGEFMLLKEMGYIDEIDNIELEKPVSRGKFARWLSITANIVNEKSIYSIPFDDVHITNAYYDDIQRVVSKNYMQGYADNTFKPNDHITQQEAIFALLNLAGYESYATIKGGYPNGYKATASSLGILDGASSGVDAYNVLVMIFNTLETKYLYGEGLSGNRVLYSRDETVLAHYHNIYQIEGRMTANQHTKLYSDDVIGDKKTCEIDKVKYIMDGDYNDLIGMIVRGWYKTDTETDTNSIVTLYAHEKDNKVLELDAKDIVRIDNECNIYYETENYRTKKAKLIRGFDYIYNNRIVLDVTFMDLNITDGSLRLIDYNDDGIYDTVFAKESETMKVIGVDNYSMRIYSEHDVIELNSAVGAEMKIYAKNDDGSFKQVTIDWLEKEQIMTVYRSKDNVYIEVYAVSKSTGGIVGEVNKDENYIVVDGVSYEVIFDETFDGIGVGSDINIYLDIYDRIVYADIIGGSQKFEYAYLFSTRYDYDEDAVNVKLITAAGQKNFIVSEKVILDGVSAEQSGILALGKQMIRYRTNKAGEIKAIDTPTTVTSDTRNDTLKSLGIITNKSFNAQPQIIDDKFKIKPETFMLRIPSNPAEKNDISLYTQTTPDSDTPTAIHQFEIFDVNDEDMSIGAYLYYSEGSLATPTELNAQASVGVVDKVMRIWYDGEDRLMIRLFINDTLEEFLVNTNENDTNFEFGDVVRYKQDANGDVWLTPELDVGRTGPQDTTIVNPATDYKYNIEFGRILNRQEEYLVLLSGENNSGYLDPPTFENRKIISTLKTRSCILVDMAERKISNIDAKNYTQYIPGKSTPSYAYAKMIYHNELQKLVIYNY